MEGRTPPPSEPPREPVAHDPAREPVAHEPAREPVAHDPARDRVAHEPPRDTTKAGALARIGAVILALVLAFVTAVMVVAMLDIADTDTCADVFGGAGQLNADGECYDGSDSTKTISVILGLAGALFAGLATLLALAFAIRGRGGRPLVGAIVVGAVLIALALLIG